MSPEGIIKARLAMFAYEEAAHMGGANAMLAVASVVRNRVRKGWANGDWMKVMNTASQASATEPIPMPEYDLNSGGFRRVLQEIDDIYTGIFTDDLTGKDPRDPKRRDGGLYYMDAFYSDNGRILRPWFEEKILHDQAHHPRIAQVGMLYIYA